MDIGALLHRARAPVATAAGVALGAVSAVVGLLFLLFCGAAALVAAVPPARHPVTAAVARYARRLADLEHQRLTAFGRDGTPPATAATSTPRVLGYLAARLLPGVLGALTVGLLAVGVVLAGIVLVAFARDDLSPLDLLLQVTIGAALLVVNVQAISSIAALDRRLARALLWPSPRELLERRVSELAASRAGVVAAVDAERQRIERDLHDGLQQRLVALGMLLGRARRSTDPTRVLDLVRQAHVDTQQAIDELRAVAWRVYPAALDHAGLDEVLDVVAQRSTVPVRITYDLPTRPPRQVETVLYFVACEAITNAAKHSGATVISIGIGARTGPPDTVVEMYVHDDGTGGADPAGSGLSGLARRVAALDGSLRVDSPPGGPTTLRVVLPCG